MPMKKCKFFLLLTSDRKAVTEPGRIPRGGYDSDVHINIWPLLAGNSDRARGNGLK